MPGQLPRLDAASALAAVTREFGVRLPRHAIVSGRLHTFSTRSWTRPPRPDEPYAVITIILSAPKNIPIKGYEDLKSQLPLSAKVYLIGHRPQAPVANDALNRIEYSLQQIQFNQIRLGP